MPRSFSTGNTLPFSAIKILHVSGTLRALTAEVELRTLTAEVELGALTAEVEPGALTAEVELRALTTISGYNHKDDKGSVHKCGNGAETAIP